MKENKEIDIEIVGCANAERSSKLCRKCRRNEAGYEEYQAFVVVKKIMQEESCMGFIEKKK